MIRVEASRLISLRLEGCCVVIEARMEAVQHARMEAGCLTPRMEAAKHPVSEEKPPGIQCQAQEHAARAPHPHAARAHSHLLHALFQLLTRKRLRRDAFLVFAPTPPCAEEMREKAHAGDSQ